MNRSMKCRVSAGWEKPTRTELLKWIDDNLSNMDCETLVGKIWRYFDPITVFRNDDKWVLSVVSNSTQKDHQNLTHPFVADGKLIGTNGRSIHIVNNDPRKDGYYHRDTFLPIAFPHKTPNYRAVLPERPSSPVVLQLDSFGYHDRDTLLLYGVRFQRYDIMLAFGGNTAMHGPRDIGRLDNLRIDSIDGKRTALVSRVR